MLIQLPGGSAIDSQGDVLTADDNGEIRLHTQLALSRLIERWLDKDNLRALLTSYTDEVQALENAIWDVIVSRLPDYAEGAQLDALGRIVGERRQGRSDARYRIWIKARIKINMSYGRARDVLEVLQLVEPATPRLTEFETAAFRISYSALVLNDAAMAELPAVIRQTRAAGVYGCAQFATDDARGFLCGDTFDVTLGAEPHGCGDFLDSATGGLLGHFALA